MLTPQDLKAIESSITEEEPSADVLLRVERAGDDAFDVICHALIVRPLSAQERVNALRRLALLTRQQCYERNEEVMEIALRLLEHEDLLVRSGAAHTVIVTTLIIERFPNRTRAAKYKLGTKPSLREQMKAAIQAAMARGIDDEQNQFAHRFLADQI